MGSKNKRLNTYLSIPAKIVRALMGLVWQSATRKQDDTFEWYMFRTLYQTAYS
jgi:hypothetical protein